MFSLNLLRWSDGFYPALCWCSVRMAASMLPFVVGHSERSFWCTIGFDLSDFVWDFSIYIQHSYWSMVFIFIVVLSGFQIKAVGPHRRSLVGFPPFSSFQTIWEGFVLVLPYKFGRIHQWNHLVPGFPLLWDY